MEQQEGSPWTRLGVMSFLGFGFQMIPVISFLGIVRYLLARGVGENEKVFGMKASIFLRFCKLAKTPQMPCASFAIRHETSQALAV